MGAVAVLLPAAVEEAWPPVDDDIGQGDIKTRQLAKESSS